MDKNQDPGLLEEERKSEVQTETNTSISENEETNANRKQIRRNAALHAAILFGVLLVLFFAMTKISQKYRYADVFDAIYEEERAALDLAQAAYTGDLQNLEARKQQDELSRYRMLRAAHVLFDNWEDYRKQPAEEAQDDEDDEDDEDEDEVPSAELTPAVEIPAGMTVSRKQLLANIQKSLGAQVVELQYDEIPDAPVIAGAPTDGDGSGDGRTSVSGQKDAKANKLHIAADTAGEGITEIPEGILTQLYEQAQKNGEATILNSRYRYSAVKSGNRTIYAAFPNNTVNDEETISESLLQRMNSLRFGADNTGSVLMINVKKDIVLTSDNADAIGRNASVLGYEYEPAEEDICDMQEILGEDKLVRYRKVSDSVVLCAVMARSSLDLTVLRSCMIDSLVFLAVLLGVFLYAVIQLTARWGRGTVRTMSLGNYGYLDMSLLGHMIPVIIFCVVLSLAASFYGQELVSLSLKTMQNSNRINQIHLEDSQRASVSDALITDTQNEYLSRIRIANDWLDIDPGFLKAEKLQKLATSLGIESLDIYTGADYELIATTSQQGTAKKETDQTEFNEIMSGTAKNKIIVLDSSQSGQTDGNADEYRCEVAVRRNDNSGMIIAVLGDNIISPIIKESKTNNTIRYYYNSANEVYLCLDAETQTVKTSNISKWAGLSLTEIGMTDKVLTSHDTDFQTLDGDMYYITSRKSGNVYEVIGTKSINIIKDVLSYVRFVPLAALILLLIFAAAAVICPGEFAEQDKKPEEFSFTDWSAEAERNEGYFEKKRRHWRFKTPEERYGSALQALLLIQAFCIVAAISYGLRLEELSEKTGILHYIFYGDWEEGWNIFGVTGVIMTISMGTMVSWIVRWLLRNVASFFGRHTQSVAYMLDGFIGYLFAVIVLFMSLAELGIKPAALATGAGVISIVIGIGAQSLVGDILTGIFIVMENEFSKGDFIQVEDWSGRVAEIGIRTTKVRDIHGNVKIFNNSVIRSVINKSTENTIAHILVNVAYSENLPRVEEILRDSMPAIRRAVPLMLQDPTYFGVKELGESAVVLEIHVVCREENLLQVSAQTKRELKLLLDANGIEIPFNQIVIHEAAAKTK